MTTSKPIIIEDPTVSYLDPDVEKALEIMRMKHEGVSNTLIAERLHVDRVTVQRWLARWEASGVWDDAKTHFMRERKEAVERATIQAYERLPGMINHMANIASGFMLVPDDKNKGEPKEVGVSAFVAVQAFTVLKEQVFDPFLNQQQKPDNQADDYAAMVAKMTALESAHDLILNRAKKG